MLRGSLPNIKRQIGKDKQPLNGEEDIWQDNIFPDFNQNSTESWRLLSTHKLVPYRILDWQEVDLEDQLLYIARLPVCGTSCKIQNTGTTDARIMAFYASLHLFVVLTAITAITSAFPFSPNIVAFSTQSTVEPTPVTKVDDKFRDPGLFHRIRQNYTKVEHIKPKLTNLLRPACTKSDMETFCDKEDVLEYPEDMINSLVRTEYNRIEFSELFGLGAGTGEEITIRRVDSTVAEMTDDENDETNICDKKTTVFYPRTARNKQKDWVYIVNDAEYVQAVTSEKCTNEGTTCNYLSDQVTLDFKSRCRQKYSFKKLLAIHPDEKKAYTDFFPIPSCCSCYVSSFLGLGRKTDKSGKNVTTVNSN